MPEHAVVLVEFIIRKFARDELASGVFGIVAPDLREDLAKSSGEVDEGLILLRREIILHQGLALNLTGHKFRTRRVSHEIRGADAAVAEPRRDGDARLAVRVL